MPGAADTGIINWTNNTVTVSTVTPEVEEVQVGQDEPGNLVVEAGGDLNVGFRLYAGHSNATDPSTLTVQSGGNVDVGEILWVAGDAGASPEAIVGVCNIEAGGVINVASHLWWAPGAGGDATVNIHGTLNQTGGILGLGTINAADASGGVATVNIYAGGILGLNNISSSGISIFPGSVINLYGTGVITISGDHVDAIPQYITNGFIVAEDGAGEVIVTFDAGVTTIGVVPPPPPVITPSSPFAIADQSFSLSAPTGGTGYQWSMDGGDLSDGGSISGATTNVLTFDPLAEGDEGLYEVSYNDGSKAPVDVSYFLTVLPSGTILPLTGLLDLGLLAGACAFGGASARLAFRVDGPRRSGP